jgi:flagellar protein FliO/FliZ
MEVAGLLLRVVVSLGLVLAVLWFAAKGLRSSQRRSRAGVDVDVLTRQPLAQKSSLAVVRLGDRALVLGVTESRVELLHETALADVLLPEPESAQPASAQPVPQPGQVPALRPVPERPVAGRLAGSALSPQTWSRAVQVLREKAVRQ